MKDRAQSPARASRRSGAAPPEHPFGTAETPSATLPRNHFSTPVAPMRADNREIRLHVARGFGDGRCRRFFRELDHAVSCHDPRLANKFLKLALRPFPLLGNAILEFLHRHRGPYDRTPRIGVEHVQRAASEIGSLRPTKAYSEDFKLISVVALWPGSDFAAALRLNRHREAQREIASQFENYSRLGPSLFCGP